MTLDAREGYDFLQSSMSPTEKIAEDNFIRENQKPRVPAAPTLTTTELKYADGSSYATVTVTWTPVRKDLDYIVRWKLSTDVNYTYDNVRFTAAATSGIFVIRPLPTNAAINVAVAADYRLTGSRSEFSADQSITTAQDTSAPATPTGFTATANTNSKDVILNWSANTESDLAYYQIQRSTSSGGETNYVQAQLTQYSDSNVTLGTTYFYKLKAVDRSGNSSAATAEVSAKPIYTGPVSGLDKSTTFSPPADGLFHTTWSQAVTIPSGSQKLRFFMIVTGLGGANTYQFRFSIDTSGSNLSNVIQTSTNINTYTELKSSAVLAAGIANGAIHTIIFETKSSSGAETLTTTTSAGEIVAS